MLPAECAPVLRLPRALRALKSDRLAPVDRHHGRAHAAVGRVADRQGHAVGLGQHRVVACFLPHRHQRLLVSAVGAPGLCA